MKKKIHHEMEAAIATIFMLVLISLAAWGIMKLFEDPRTAALKEACTIAALETNDIHSLPIACQEIYAHTAN